MGVLYTEVQLGHTDLKLVEMKCESEKDKARISMSNVKSQEIISVLRSLGHAAYFATVIPEYRRVLEAPDVRR